MGATTQNHPEQERDTPMTFADLLATLETRAALPAAGWKDCKTSLRYLASALGPGVWKRAPWAPPAGRPPGGRLRWRPTSRR